MKISIIIPSYNTGAYIKKAIDSAFNQPYQDKEIIVIDGGSTNGTVDILKSYDPKISWISEKDSGQSNAINKGFKKATGEIVAWLNTDDFYEPDVLGDVVQAFTDHPEVDLVYGNCRSVSSTHSRIDIPSVPPTAKKLTNAGCSIYGPACFYRASAVKEVGYVDESLHFWMDHDLFIRLLTKGKSFHVNKLLANFVIRDGQKSDLKNIHKMDEELLLISKRYGGHFLNRIRLASWYHMLKFRFQKK